MKLIIVILLLLLGCGKFHRGEQGEPGAKGDIGGTGIQGDIGQRGDTGTKGDQGSPGQKGDTGSPGISCTLVGTILTCPNGSLEFHPKRLFCHCNIYRCETLELEDSQIVTEHFNHHKDYLGKCH